MWFGAKGILNSNPIIRIMFKIPWHPNSFYTFWTLSYRNGPYNFTRIGLVLSTHSILYLYLTAIHRSSIILWTLYCTWRICHRVKNDQQLSSFSCGQLYIEVKATLYMKHNLSLYNYAQYKYNSLCGCI